MTLALDAPVPTGKPATPVMLAGKLLPWHEDCAVFASMPITPQPGPETATLPDKP